MTTPAEGATVVAVVNWLERSTALNISCTVQAGPPVQDWTCSGNATANGDACTTGLFVASEELGLVDFPEAGVPGCQVRIDIDTWDGSGACIDGICGGTLIHGAGIGTMYYTPPPTVGGTSEAFPVFIEGSCGAGGGSFVVRGASIEFGSYRDVMGGLQFDDCVGNVEGSSWGTYNVARAT